MKFSCGLTVDAKYNKMRQELLAEVARLKEWHKVFIIFPRTVGTDGDRNICAALQYVERRYPYAEIDFFSFSCIGTRTPEYRLIKEE